MEQREIDKLLRDWGQRNPPPRKRLAATIARLKPRLRQSASPGENPARRHPIQLPPISLGFRSAALSIAAIAALLLAISVFFPSRPQTESAAPPELAMELENHVEATRSRLVERAEPVSTSEPKAAPAPRPTPQPAPGMETAKTEVRPDLPARSIAREASPGPERLSEAEPSMALRARVSAPPRPTLIFKINERRQGEIITGRGLETELARIAGELNFRVLEASEEDNRDIDFVIYGEAVSELTDLPGPQFRVRYRVELSAATRDNGQEIINRRRTVLSLDASEQAAIKSARQEAANELAREIFPQLTK